MLHIWSAVAVLPEATISFMVFRLADFFWDGNMFLLNVVETVKAHTSFGVDISENHVVCEIITENAAELYISWMIRCHMA